MKNKGLTLKDRLGMALGTGIFLLMLPVTIFVSSVPTLLISNAIPNKVLSLTLNMGFLAVGALMTFLVAMMLGLAGSYFLGWFGKLLNLGTVFAEVANRRRPIEACRKLNLGAFAGMAVAAVLFLTVGEAPIQSVTTRVEHLFPAPLILSLGEFFSFNVSHTYAAATGFLSVGFLFAIVGIALGSLVMAGVEVLTTRTTRATRAGR